MNKSLKLMLAVMASAFLAACGGSDDGPALVASADASLAASPTTTAAVANTPFSFPSGVTSFGTTATTTVAFTNTATTPAFSIVSGANTATGTTTFGSCIFAITSSTFPAGSPLAAGQTITVNPCNINVASKGLPANSQAATRSVALLLGAAASAGVSVTVGVNPGGQLTLNGREVGTVTLTPVTGATGGSS
jgi:hypothetical protein